MHLGGCRMGGELQKLKFNIMMKRVSEKDKEHEVEKLQTVLNGLGFQFNYQQADLINQGIKINTINATLKDLIETKKKWELKYENYKWVEI
jgi:ribosomal protein S11